MRGLFKRSPVEFRMLKPQFEESLKTVLTNSLVAACTVLERHFGFTKEQVQEFATHWNNEMDWLSKSREK